MPGPDFSCACGHRVSMHAMIGLDSTACLLCGCDEFVLAQGR